MVIKKSVGVLAIGALVPPFLLGACGSSATPAPASQAPPAASAPAASPTTPSAQVDVTEKDFDAANFPTTPKVDNRWYPLAPERSTSFRERPTAAKARARTRWCSRSPT